MQKIISLLFFLFSCEKEISQKHFYMQVLYEWYIYLFINLFIYLYVYYYTPVCQAKIQGSKKYNIQL